MAALREKAAAERAREARYRARGRIRVAAPIARPAGLVWFLPGAGRIEIFKDAEITPQMVVVPAGEFWMGSKDGEGNEDERPRHKVTIAKPFAVGRYAVTFDEWDAARAAGGVSHDPACQFRGRGRRPVVNVSWDDAQAYIEWLWSKTGQRYRLLSEAEWEYCCRAGTETQYWWGDEISTKQANYDGNYTSGKGAEDEYSPKTLPVNSFRPNPWGLYQVHGNVWEWCQDCWNGDYHNAPAGGSAWTAGDGQVPGPSRRLLGRRSGDPPPGAPPRQLAARPLRRCRAAGCQDVKSLFLNAYDSVGLGAGGPKPPCLMPVFRRRADELRPSYRRRRYRSPYVSLARRGRSHREPRHYPYQPKPSSRSFCAVAGPSGRPKRRIARANSPP